MGFFDRLKKNTSAKKQSPENHHAVDNSAIIIAAAISGSVIPMEQIADPVFSSGMLGKCCGIKPSTSQVTSPVDGEIIQLSDTLHAIGIRDKKGAEILLHIGIDTVEMNGDGFQTYVNVGDHVKTGQNLITMDLDKIRKAGYDTTVITVIVNSQNYANITVSGTGTIEAGENLLTLS